MKKYFALAAALLLFTSPGFSQVEGPVSTQILVGVDSKSEQAPALADVILKVNGKEEPVTAWSQVPPNGVQIAVLIDDGLRESVGREMDSLRNFARELPNGTQIFIGYMRNGTIFKVQDFTTDHNAAASRFRLPVGSPGISASPYFCLSEFVKNWPADSSQPAARFVLMITNGVDPYNGSTSPLNQNSPYVDQAQTDAQRAGVSVSSIYYADAGFRGRQGSFSGQGYLSQVAEQTGGNIYLQGTGNPISMEPFLREFRHAISETYIATFVAKASGNKLAEVKVETKVHGIKLHGPKAVRPGNLESTPAQ